MKYLKYLLLITSNFPDRFYQNKKDKLIRKECYLLENNVFESTTYFQELMGTVLLWD